MPFFSIFFYDFLLIGFILYSIPSPIARYYIQACEEYHQDRRSNRSGKFNELMLFRRRLSSQIRRSRCSAWSYRCQLWCLLRLRCVCRGNANEESQSAKAIVPPTDGSLCHNYRREYGFRRHKQVVNHCSRYSIPVLSNSQIRCTTATWRHRQSPLPFHHWRRRLNHLLLVPV